MVISCVTKVITLCSPMIGQFFDTMIVASGEDILPWSRPRRDLECHEHHGKISTISARFLQSRRDLGNLSVISPRSRRDLESNKHHGEISARSRRSWRDIGEISVKILHGISFMYQPYPLAKHSSALSLNALAESSPQNNPNRAYCTKNETKFKLDWPAVVLCVHFFAKL